MENVISICGHGGSGKTTLGKLIMAGLKSESIDAHLVEAGQKVISTNDTREAISKARDCGYEVVVFDSNTLSTISSLAEVSSVVIYTTTPQEWELEMATEKYDVVKDMRTPVYFALTRVTSAKEELFARATLETYGCTVLPGALYGITQTGNKLTKPVDAPKQEQELVDGLVRRIEDVKTLRPSQ